MAAPQQIAVKPLTFLTTLGTTSQVAGVLTKGSQIYIFGNTDNGPFIRAIDPSGKELWRVVLDSDQPAIATAGAIDGAGNIWVAGSTSLKSAVPTPAQSLAPINPDGELGVIQETTHGLDAVALWEIPAGGTTPNLFTAKLQSEVLITAVAADKNGLTLAGVAATEKGSSGFFVNTNIAGEFMQSVRIGTQGTGINATVRHRDGSKTLIGNSAETLGGKKLAGISDGVIIKVDAKDVVTQIVRSSEAKANRSWDSASTSLLFGGSIIKGTQIQSAVTKFSTSYSPQWTARFASTGATFTFGTDRAFFASTSPISTLRAWAPKSARPLLLTFDTKGLISAAFSAPLRQSDVFGLIESKEIGLIALTTSEGVISAYVAK